MGHSCCPHSHSAQRRRGGHISLPCGCPGHSHKCGQQPGENQSGRAWLLGSEGGPQGTEHLWSGSQPACSPVSSMPLGSGPEVQVPRRGRWQGTGPQADSCQTLGSRPPALFHLVPPHTSFRCRAGRGGSPGQAWAGRWTCAGRLGLICSSGETWQSIFKNCYKIYITRFAILVIFKCVGQCR